MALLSSVSIIGLGLIGSSLARAIKENGIASTIFGYDCNPAHSAFCLTHRIIDQACATEEEIARASSFLVLCTPPAAASAMMHTIGKKLPPGCVVTDTASVKQFMADNIIPHISGAARYVPAHPIAGNEKSGPEGGSASLFMRRKTILCPQESELSDSETTLVKRFWERVGSSVEFMPPDIHDKIYGCISHLPQLLSFAMVPVMKTAGSGAWTAPVQRFTRLCHSPTGLWAELFVLNSAALLESLKQYETLLRQIVVDFRHGARQGQPSTQKGDATLLYFPRVAASCLAIAASKLERTLGGVPLARYAGTGFADFSAPATDTPEADIESISGQYQSLLPLLDIYFEEIAILRRFIEVRDMASLKKRLEALSDAAGSLPNYGADAKVLHDPLRGR